MILIIGLGNQGKEYQNTRHNIGFMVLDALAFKYQISWSTNKKAQLSYAKFHWLNNQIELIKPLSFMNNSGGPVSFSLRQYKGKIKQIFLIHDDLDLDLGRLKIQQGGGDAGHHGVESIKTVMSKKNKYDISWEQVIRFRLGIGRPSLLNQKYKTTADYKKIASQSGEFCAYQGLRNYVLTKFSQNQKEIANNLIEECVKAIENTIQYDIETAMNKFN